MNRKKELGIENKQGMWNEEMDNGFKFSLKTGSFSHVLTFWCNFSVEFVKVKKKVNFCFILYLFIYGDIDQFTEAITCLWDRSELCSLTLKVPTVVVFLLPTSVFFHVLYHNDPQWLLRSYQSKISLVQTALIWCLVYTKKILNIQLYEGLVSYHSHFLPHLKSKRDLT